MPVKVPKYLPAADALREENIFVMPSARAESQDIRPLKICLLNLMPTKEVTEMQLIRLLSNSPLQIELTLLYTASYQPTHTATEHLHSFYKTFDEIRGEKFDGMIITGAPVEKLAFEEVAYWPELTKILDWCKTNVFATLHICWGAQAGLYYYYGIGKYPTGNKISGIFEHVLVQPTSPLLRGFDDVFLAPHSRNTEVRRDDILACPEIDLLAESEEAGVYLVASKDLRRVFITGHGEYDVDTLHQEYLRDLGKGLDDIRMPLHYYVNDEIGKLPPLRWRSSSMLLLSNWLNYCVYQSTPYDYTK